MDVEDDGGKLLGLTVGRKWLVVVVVGDVDDGRLFVVVRSDDVYDDGAGKQ